MSVVLTALIVRSFAPASMLDVPRILVFASLIATDSAAAASLELSLEWLLLAVTLVVPLKFELLSMLMGVDVPVVLTVPPSIVTDADENPMKPPISSSVTFGARGGEPLIVPLPVAVIEPPFLTWMSAWEFGTTRIAESGVAVDVAV